MNYSTPTRRRDRSRTLRTVPGLHLLCALALLGVACGDDDVTPMNDAGPTMDAFIPSMDGGMDAGTDAGTDATTPDAGTDAGTDAGPADLGEVTRGRLLIADHAAASAIVLDLDDEAPAAIATFELTEPARAYGDALSRYGYLIQRSANQVAIVESGVILESHIDHYHIRKEAPERLDLTLEDEAPTHWTFHDGWVSVFYDGTGNVDVLQERSISAGMPVVRPLITGPAHHGVAVAAHGHVMATIGTEGEALPTQVGVWPITEMDGEPEVVAGPCPGLHGETAAGEFVLYGCSDQVFGLELHGDHFDAISIPNPEGTIDGTRVGTLASFEAEDGTAHFVGNWGSEGLAWIDPEARVLTPVATPAQVVSFKFDLTGEYVVAFTADGMLHRFSASDGAPAGGPIELSDPISLDGGHGAARPSLTPGAGAVYVALPADGVVVEIEIEEWSEHRRFEVGGAPYSMAVLTSSPDWESAHEHDHED